jgi:tRNA threonylcarbamoyladenosine biosynthesis protein TsaB
MTNKGRRPDADPAAGAEATVHALDPEAPILAIDTALQRAVVAIGRADGRLVAEDAWVAGHRHGEELLARIAALLARAGLPLAELRGIVVGTGPGAFTGLRVGIATAKALAHGLGVPIVGISTAVALEAAAPSAGTLSAVLLPAGPSDRVLVVGGRAVLLPAGSEPEAALLSGLLAVDLAGRAAADAVDRGDAAVVGLGASLVRLGATRLGRGDVDDLARLVPEYVVLPRGVTEQRGEVAWSRGRG